MCTNKKTIKNKYSFFYAYTSQGFTYESHIIHQSTHIYQLVALPKTVIQPLHGTPQFNDPSILKILETRFFKISDCAAFSRLSESPVTNTLYHGYY